VSKAPFERRVSLPVVGLLLLVSTLAGAVATTGAAITSRGLAISARVPASARVYAVALRRRADEAAQAAAQIAGVRTARLRGLGELLPSAPAAAGEPQRLRVIDLEVDIDSVRLTSALEELRGVTGVVDVVDANAAERRRYTRARSLVLVLGGAGLVALGALAYVLGVAATARVAARERRDEIALRHLLGADPQDLWMPFARTFGLTAVLGVVTTAVLALLAARALRGEGGVALDAAALLWLGAGAGAWLFGTAALSVAATRQAVLRVARTAIAISAILVVLVARASAVEGEPDELARAGDELRRVARELAVARHAEHRAEQRLADSERVLLAALLTEDAVAEGLARAQLQSESDRLERWRRRHEHLRLQRAELRVRHRAARDGPPIEPRVVPVAGEVAVPFGRPEQRLRTAAFRHGIGLRVASRETIVATAPGRVAYAGNLAGTGPVVVVDHGRRIYSVYGRIGAPLVQLGAKVGSGEPVARGPERAGVLYFSVRQRGRAIDPLLWIQSSRPESGFAGAAG
jgi:murein DD-endopeptidase MepM/ murein hydrolase activator NlpD